MNRQASKVMQKEFDKAKLEFPFEGDLLEIQNEAGKWLQTTRITFRSYDGPRRITNYDTSLTIDPLSSISNSCEYTTLNVPLQPPSRLLP